VTLSTLGGGELRFGVSEWLVDFDVNVLSTVSLDLDPVVDSRDDLGGESDWVPGVEGSSEVGLGVPVVLGSQGCDLRGDRIKSSSNSSAKHFIFRITVLRILERQSQFLFSDLGPNFSPLNTFLRNLKVPGFFKKSSRKI